jgi:PAS domain-containing protein
VVELDLDLLPDAVVRIDAGHVVVAANAAAEQLAGAALTGRRLADALDPLDPDGRGVFATCWPRAAVLRSVSAMPELELVIRGADGVRRAVNVTARYERDASGALTGAVLVLRPVRRLSSPSIHRADALAAVGGPSGSCPAITLSSVESDGLPAGDPPNS